VTVVSLGPKLALSGPGSSSLLDTVFTRFDLDEPAVTVTFDLHISSGHQYEIPSKFH